MSLFSCGAEHLAQFIDDAPALGIKALSVTMPHKEAVIAKLNEVDDAVGGIGATNTILFDGKKSMGFNTDYRARWTAWRRPSAAPTASIAA